MPFSLPLWRACISIDHPTVADCVPTISATLSVSRDVTLARDEFTTWSAEYGTAQVLDAAWAGPKRAEPFLDLVVGAPRSSTPQAIVVSQGVQVVLHSLALSRVSEATGTPATARTAVSTVRLAGALVVAPAGSVPEGGGHGGLHCAA